MPDFVIGQRWLCDADPALGLGTVKAVDQRTVTVAFSATGETRVYARQSAPLTRVVFSAGDVVPSRAGWSLSVDAVSEDQDVLVYAGADEQGRQVTLAETDLADVIALQRPADRLFSGRIDPDKWFRLRYQALNEHHRHLSSDLYGMTGTRTSLIPHQLYIAREVGRRYAPRVLLADEVGLGKTIEAGLILHQQLLTERARRVLIVVPDNLVYQWLVEMLRRFNLYFSIFDEDRCKAVTGSAPGDNPFMSEQLVLCSLSFLAGPPHRLEQVIAGDWDLLVIDEAHHLHWTPQDASPEYRIVEQLALHTRGILLLTATPEQLGKAGHFARLRLLDPDRFADYETFIRDEETYGAVARVIGALLDAAPLTDQAIADLSVIIHDDPGQQLLSRINDPLTDIELKIQSRRELIEMLVDRHGTGRVLFRNTRAAIKGFPERAVSVYPLPLPEAYTAVLTDDKDQDLDQQQLLLSPEALYRKGSDRAAPHWTRIDPRMAWLTDLLKQLKPARVLVITAMRETAMDITEALKIRSGIHAAVFHEGTGLLERDRAAAHFADAEHGCQVLICSEIGSEGRNFQFAHHLVLFDLPLNPDLLEQRIGRLDRIGQTETIHIHVPYLQNSAQSVMYHWYQEGLNAFTHTCPAGYPVFYQLQAPLLAALREATLEHHDLPEFIQRTRKLCHEVNRVLQEGRDRLLEYNSCRPEIAAGLKQAAEQQDAASTIEQFMDNVFDCFGVHVEEHGRSSFIISPSEKMHAPYPGLHDEGMTITYDRATALANEDMQFLTWEHPMVITGIDMVLSNEFGNAVVCAMEHKALQPGTLLLESLYVLEPARLAGAQVNGYFPPVMFRILVDARGNVRHAAINHDAVNAGASYVVADIARQVIQMKDDEIRTMLKRSGQLADEQVPAIIGAAQARIEQSLSSELTRLEVLSRVNKNIRAEELDYCRRQRQLLLDTARSAKLRLDALRVIVVTRPD